jgi:hypothetical protein
MITAVFFDLITLDHAEMGNSNSELELTPELTLFFIGVGAELEWNFAICG